MTENNGIAVSQIVSVAQLPVIVERLQSAKEQVEARTAEAKSLVCTADTLKAVKETRAALNRDFDLLEEQRKAVKASILSPYEAFEKTYKDCVTVPFESADADLKAKIGKVEGALKQEKEREIVQYFDEYKTARHVEWLTFADSKITVGLSSTKKSLKEQAKAFVDRIAEDVETIQRTQPADADEILVEYRHSLSVSYAVETVQRRKAALEEQRRQREEREAALAAEQEAARKAKEAAAQQEAVPEAIKPPAVDVPAKTNEKRYVVGFKVVGTLEQIKALKKFLIDGGYTYEQL